MMGEEKEFERIGHPGDRGRKPGDRTGKKEQDPGMVVSAVHNRKKSRGKRGV